MLGELRAHNTQINAIATNEQLIFTASKYVYLVSNFVFQYRWLQIIRKQSFINAMKDNCVGPENTTGIEG